MNTLFLLPVAPIDRRVRAALIDYLQMAAFCFVFSLVFGKREGFQWEVSGNIVALPLVWWAFYFIVLEWLFQGTPGKKLLGLKLVSEDGSRLSLVRTAGRRLLDPIDVWALAGLVGLLRIYRSNQGQRLGDFCSRSLVVLDDPGKERRPL